MDVRLSLKSCHPAALQSDGPKDPHHQIYGAGECTHTYKHAQNSVPLCIKTVFQFSHHLLLSSHILCLQMLSAILSCASLYYVFVNAAVSLAPAGATFGIWCQLTATHGEGTDTHGRGTNSALHLSVVHQHSIQWHRWGNRCDADGIKKVLGNHQSPCFGVLRKKTFDANWWTSYRASV